METPRPDPEIEKASFRARLAMWSLGCGAAFAAVSALAAARALTISDDYAQLHVLEMVLKAERVVTFITAVLVGAWMHRATLNVQRHLGGAVSYSPVLAAASFCLPLLKAFLPFVFLRSLREQSSPEAFPPVQRAVQVSPENYRDGGARVETLAPKIPKAPVEAWWAVAAANFVVAVPMYLVMQALGVHAYAGFAVLRVALTIAASVLGGMTIYAIDQAQVERAARLAHASAAPRTGG